MLIDPRPLERITSVMIVGVVAFMALTFGGFGFLAGLAVIFDYPLVGLGTWCLTLPTVPVVALVLLWVLAWTRRGSVVAYTDVLEASLGVSGSLDRPRLWLPTITPEWTGTLGDRTVRVRLRRTAGFLSPMSPAGGLGIPWTLQAHLSGHVPGEGKVGFVKANAAALGMGLLGLTNPIEREGVKLFVGDRPQVADDEAVLACAGAMIYGPTSLVSVESDGMWWNDRLSDMPAEALAERLALLDQLLSALEDAGA
jgi:hypothetical protein